MKLSVTDKAIKTATIGIIIYLICFGIAMAIFPIRPFWNDEWRLVYNIKFKSILQLWGTLDLVQQCPRVYLSALKIFTSFFDYSYTALRTPALVLSVASIFLCFHLKKKIYPQSTIYSYLFILVLMSSQTFTDYIVQVKHYEMDIFLSLLSLWQLLILLRISRAEVVGKYSYLFLCFSLLIAPFFSYIYPITIAPVFPIILLSTIVSLRKNLTSNKVRWLFRLYFPLFIVFVSILIFYFIDVKQLMADNAMYMSYWEMMGNKELKNPFLFNVWELFALVGSGLVFEIIFGILGIFSFSYAVYSLAKRKKWTYVIEDYLKLYAILLIIITLGFIFFDKLIGGVARLTAFTVPSIAMLIVTFLTDLKANYHKTKLANTLATILFLGLFGNILSTCINCFTYPEYKNRIETYWRIGDAIKEARVQKVPLLITQGVLGDKIEEHALMPGKIQTDNFTGANVMAKVAIVDHPEYKHNENLIIFPIPDMKWADEYVKQLPMEYKSAIVFDGITILQRNR